MADSTKKVCKFKADAKLYASTLVWLLDKYSQADHAFDLDLSNEEREQLAAAHAIAEHAEANGYLS